MAATTVGSENGMHPENSLSSDLSGGVSNIDVSGDTVNLIYQAISEDDKQTAEKIKETANLYFKSKFNFKL